MSLYSVSIVLTLSFTPGASTRVPGQEQQQADVYNNCVATSLVSGGAISLS
jgi:hypothetical protein